MRAVSTSLRLTLILYFWQTKNVQGFLRQTKYTKKKQVSNKNLRGNGILRYFFVGCDIGWSLLSLHCALPLTKITSKTAF